MEVLNVKEIKNTNDIFILIFASINFNTFYTISSYK